jgi:hypothetical protein
MWHPVMVWVRRDTGWEPARPEMPQKMIGSRFSPRLRDLPDRWLAHSDANVVREHWDEAIPGRVAKKLVDRAHAICLFGWKVRSYAAAATATPD